MNWKSMFLSACVMAIVFGVRPPSSGPSGVSAQEVAKDDVALKDFNAVIKLFKDYRDNKGGKLGYDARGYMSTSGRVVRRATKDDKVEADTVDFNGLGCSSFVTAALHRLQGNSDWKKVSTTAHQKWGDKIAEHYKLAKHEFAVEKDKNGEAKYTVARFLEDAAAKKLPNGIFMFDVRDKLGARGLVEGEKHPDTGEKIVKADMGHGHVGFLVISKSGEIIRHAQFTSSGDWNGLADADTFVAEWLENHSYYSKGGLKDTSTISLYVVNPK